MVNISFHSTDKKQEWVGVDRGWALRHFSYRHTQKALSFPSFMWLCFIRNFQQCGFLPERWENCTLPNPTREGCFCYRIEIKYVDEKEKKKREEKTGPGTFCGSICPCLKDVVAGRKERKQLMRIPR